MRFILITVLLTCSLQLVAESWFGYCVVERDRQRICSDAHPRRGDFSPICDSFARDENAAWWRAHFGTDLNLLRLSMADNCDVIRDGGEKSMFACQLATYCPGEEASNISHLASRVYSENATSAISACLEKEEYKYTTKLKEESIKGCYVRIAVESITVME